MPKYATVGHIDDSLTREEVAREYRRRYSLAAYHNKRAHLIRQLGGKCKVCGGRERLTIVKKTKSKAKFAISKLTTMSEKRRQHLLKSVEVLCFHHAQLRLGKNKLTHGTYWAAYKKKCRCEQCQEFMADYALRRRENRRAKKAALAGGA